MVECRNIWKSAHPLLWQTCKCSAHERTFTRLRYILSFVVTYKLNLLLHMHAHVRLEARTQENANGYISISHGWRQAGDNEGDEFCTCELGNTLLNAFMKAKNSRYTVYQRDQPQLPSSTMKGQLLTVDVIVSSVFSSEWLYYIKSIYKASTIIR